MNWVYSKEQERRQTFPASVQWTVNGEARSHDDINSAACVTQTKMGKNESISGSWLL